MKKLFLLLILTSLCWGCALAENVALPADLTAIEAEAFAGDSSLTGVLSLPDSVVTIGDAAFAETGLYALRVPAGCSHIGAEVLRGVNGGYLFLEGSDTPLDSAALGDIPFVFAPAESPAAALEGRFVDAAELVAWEGFFYRISPEGATPLCPVDRTALSPEVTLPDQVFDAPLLTLEELLMPGCEDVLLTVPCLPIPDGLNAQHDCDLAVAAITTSDLIAVDSPVTFLATIEGAALSACKWSIQHGETILQETTETPSFTFTPLYEEDITVTVTVTDAVGHTALSTAVFTYHANADSSVIYRALLVGNTYASSEKPLPGCDTDANALAAVLGSMTGSNYRVNRRYDLTANGILSEIRSTFAGADENDVSLFHFSGHGASSGALIGTGSTNLYPSTLRSVLDEIPGTKIILLDCCHSGAFISKSDGSNTPAAFNSAIISAFSWVPRGDGDLASAGYQVITACRSDQLSNTLSTSGISFGAFTYSLCYGSGYDEWHQIALTELPADADGNGALTLGENRNFIEERVAWLATMAAIDQSVQYHGDPDFVMWYK